MSAQSLRERRDARAPAAALLRQLCRRTIAEAVVFAALQLGALTGCVTPGPHAAAEPNEAGYTFVNVDDAWLRVRVTGPKDSGKTPLLLLHGFGSRLETWNRVQDALDDDRLVVSFDQRGFGHSERSEGTYGPRAHAADAFAVLAALGIDHAVVAGHSYGGGIALRMAVSDWREHESRVKGVVLVDAFALAEQVPSSFRVAQTPGLGEFIFSTLFVEAPGEKYVLAFHDGQRFATAKVLDEVRELQSRPGSTYAELATVRAMDYEFVEKDYGAATRSLPRAIVWGEKDKVTPLRQGKTLAATVDASLTVVPNCGHVPSWERPTQVIEVLRGVLAAADAGASTSTTQVPLAPIEDAPAHAANRETP